MKKKSWWSKFKKKVGKVFKTIGQTVVGLLHGKSTIYITAFQAMFGWAQEDRQLDFQTLFDAEWDRGRYMWSITWTPYGYARKKKDRRDNWIIQKIRVWKDAESCDGSFIPDDHGWPKGETTYLEAWSIKWVGWIPFVESIGDNWTQGPTELGTQGKLDQFGSALFVGRIEAPKYWAHGGSPHAGGLKSWEPGTAAQVDSVWQPILNAKHRSNAVERHRRYQWESCHTGD